MESSSRHPDSAFHGVESVIFNEKGVQHADFQTFTLRNTIRRRVLARSNQPLCHS
ncbi:hypothetical protein RB9126 [Rhodopirellula baltica SH 1]|uniref:Uncharacterized protein n=1 Tax=Rhodopirellula baltica (strain DSM 10527 / NCIMB 13988 / SH1) TaxID=243090 RepID=Q7UM19_RHOBA|nr:hypothetical protein RB9126 [Rhodopirellula baltica SH 1]